MVSRFDKRVRRRVAGVLGAALVVASCGSDDGGGSAEEAPDEAPASAPESDVGGETTDGGDTPPPTDGSETPPPTDGGGAGEGEATGEPFVIGVQTLEGDPNGSFPEMSAAIEAGAAYVNAERGGLAGRPIEIEVCASAVTPDDSQRCANELSASGVDMAISTINFFGNHFSIYQGSDIPVVVVSPITIADFTSEGVYSIGSGGGCLGAHTGLVQFATAGIEDEEDIDVQKVAVPWADTPPGVVCYNDLEAKPLDVISGEEPGDSERAGEKPDLEYLGVPIAPATPDATPQATEVLDYDPDVIIFSGQGADCWNLVDAMGRLGWTPDQIPLVLSGSCTDFEAMRAAGELATGVYFTGSGSSGLLTSLDQLEGETLEDATIYQEKALEYGLSEDNLNKGFATLSFSTVLNLAEAAAAIDGDVTGQAIADQLAATDGSGDTFGGAPLNCSGAPEPYIAVCSSAVSVTQWDGEQLIPVTDTFTGIDLVAGTELRPGS